MIFNPSLHEFFSEWQKHDGYICDEPGFAGAPSPIAVGLLGQGYGSIGGFGAWPA